MSALELADEFNDVWSPSQIEEWAEKAAYCYDNGDYMLDYSDCQSIIKGTWKRPDYNFGANK